MPGYRIESVAFEARVRKVDVAARNIGTLSRTKEVYAGGCTAEYSWLF